jgi:hypothetical protein
MLPTSLVLLAAMLAPATAGAQSASDRGAARAEFAQGERAFEDNDNEVALAHFRRAFELAPSDVVRFNIGVCLERLGRHREAVAEYEAAAASTELDAEAREQAERDAARARARLGILVVDGEPQGASVLVDGEELCTLPCEVGVDPGSHEVVVRDGDRRSEHRARVARGGRTRVTAELPQEQARAPEQPVSAAPAPSAPATETRGPGVLTWIGIGVAVVGGAGIAYFGLRTEALRDDYFDTPTRETRDDGLLMRTLTNVSIGVTALGAVLVGIDLLFLAPRDVEREATAGLRLDATGGTLRF